jgi:Fe-S cluster assembly scaffold protein SufB
MTNLKQTLESSNNIKYDLYLTGLTEETVRKISADQKEPERMLQHRLKSLEIYNNMPMPNRGPKLDEIAPLIDPSFHSPLQGEKYNRKKERQLELTQDDVKKR